MNIKKEMGFAFFKQGKFKETKEQYQFLSKLYEKNVF